ncbi:hypothetical protein DFH28DRAFT_927379 [Melampsora americana]|nr:hypothetical protein DFH28DRAFT_927379 [Melampsora americana]
MVKFWRLVQGEHNHVFGLACVLHAFNLIAKDFLNHPTMKDVTSCNKKLVNFFTSSAFWAKHLASWRKKEQVSHGLQTASESCWFSFTKVCLSVDQHEIGFLRCVEKAEDQSVVTPTIPLPIHQLVQTQDHFIANKALVDFLKPVVDALACLECKIASIADIWKEICTVYCALKTIDT